MKRLDFLESSRLDRSEIKIFEPKGRKHLKIRQRDLHTEWH